MKSIQMVVLAAFFGLQTFSGSLAYAVTPGAVPLVEIVENNPDISPDVLVSKATEKLLTQVKSASKKDKALGLSLYEHLVSESIGPFVDFKTIAFRVMGKEAYDQANEAQKMAFVEAFKRSLITTYAKGISTYDDQSVEVAPFAGIVTKNNRSRAQVQLSIIPKGGQSFPIVYSMYLDEEKGWLLENMHLDGVNVGSTFRNQFKSAYEKNLGNIDQVISNWGQKVND